MSRGLTVQQAADYCGVTISCFRTWVKSGFVPGPWPRTKRYDKKALDGALDKLSGVEESHSMSEYDKWKAKQDVGSAQTYS